MLTLEDRILWLRVALSKGVGPITFWKILQKGNGNIRHACKFVETLASEALAEKELLAHEKTNRHFLTAKDDDFPKVLLELRDCPPFLSVIGNVRLLNLPSIAIVGARNASLAGKMFAAKLAQQLGGCGFVIVSGMARGIDGAVHEGSLSTGSVAVLAGGVDVIYPSENTHIYNGLESHGTIISDMPIGTAIEATLFPRRNRIIAGMTRGIVLVEAAEHSGSLITARYALENGREIFAVPGFPADPRSKGCNSLIKQGANLVECAEDVLRAMRHHLGARADGAGAGADGFCEGARAQSAKSRGSSGLLHEDAAKEYEHKDSGRKHDKDSARGHDSAVGEYEKDTVGVIHGENGFNRANLKASILSEISYVPISIELLLQTQDCGLPLLLSVLTELENNGTIRRMPNNDVLLDV
ncbi:MAG: DNA-processing protein DprA [Holosporales bacterium]|jgi:DNA processing protein|nr:DNA-processing protein DprA [Holosporales bacterium]